MPVTHQRSTQLLRLVLFAAVLFVSLAVVSGEGTCVDVIFVGRPGDGKSTLCNIAVGRPVFPGAFKPTHVTTHHASARAPMEWTLAPGVEAVIHDTPGLDQDERYPLHRAELQRSFEKSCGRQLVVFTVGVSSGGRINAHHMQLMTAVIRAYNLRPESILFLLNMMPFDVASAADSYMNEVVAALPVELQPYAVNRLAVPYLSELAANYAESINGLGVSSTGRIHQVRKHLQAALSKLTPRSYRLEDPLALESAAETATRLQREQEQLEQQRQRAAEAQRAAAAEQERAMKEQQRLEQERAIAAQQAEVEKQQLREAAAKKGSGEPKVIREAGRALRSVRRMLKKLF